MEQAFRFGRSKHLSGILSTPDSGSSPLASPVAVIPNAGFVHHVGPFRLHVYLARALRSAGIASLRFDLSGLGDSTVPGDRKQVSERRNADLVDAIDFASTQLGDPGVVMIGLCSGASDSHQAALLDPRVKAVVMIDPPAYPNHWFFVRKALNPLRAARALARWVRKRTSGPAARPDSPEAGHGAQPAAEFAQQIERNTRNGTRYLFIYLNRRDYNHRRQLFSILTRATPRSRVDVIYEPAFDHTLVFESDRITVTEHVTRWLLEVLEDSRRKEAA